MSNIEKQNRIGARTLIKNAVAADESEPTIAGGIDASELPYVRLEVTVGGTSAGWTLTPCYAQTGDAAYKHGDPVAVSTADDASVVFIVPSYGAKDFALRCDGKYGTLPTITVYATPYGG